VVAISSKLAQEGVPETASSSEALTSCSRRASETR
jgi:hypothetical protein